MKRLATQISTSLFAATLLLTLSALNNGCSSSGNSSGTSDTSGPAKPEPPQSQGDECLKKSCGEIWLHALRLSDLDFIQSTVDNRAAALASIRSPLKIAVASSIIMKALGQIRNPEFSEATLLQDQRAKNAYFWLFQKLFDEDGSPKKGVSGRAIDAEIQTLRTS